MTLPQDSVIPAPLPGHELHAVLGLMPGQNNVLELGQGTVVTTETAGYDGMRSFKQFLMLVVFRFELLLLK